MDCAEIKVEMAEGGLLDLLVIVEEGDETKGVTSENSAAAIAESGGRGLKREEEPAGGDRSEAVKACVEKRQSDAEEDLQGEAVVTEEVKEQKDKPEQTESTNDGQDGGDSEEEGKTKAAMSRDVNSGPQGVKITQDDPEVDAERPDSSERQPEETKSREEDLKKAHRLTPDFPEALYELLCTLQEGRRLNDQRCSFRLESGVRRRRCHSEPNTTKPANRVIFSSVTSLQREEFFELVATAQARRLDDQRALLSLPLPKSRTRSLRGSIKQLSFVRRPAPAAAPAPNPTPAPVPKEDLYNMILTTQAQGRLEDQRSRAPGPMDDEDFFSLLLRVQGGRMDEQRTELPCMLQT